jgi:hypothetical protein
MAMLLLHFELRTVMVIIMEGDWYCIFLYEAAIYKKLWQEDTLTAHYGGFKNRYILSELSTLVNLKFRSYGNYFISQTIKAYYAVSLDVNLTQ